jgi:hypothetical protein
MIERFKELSLTRVLLGLGLIVLLVSVILLLSSLVQPSKWNRWR